MGERTNQRGTAYVVNQPAIVLPDYEFSASFSFTDGFEPDGPRVARIDNIVVDGDRTETIEVKRD